MGFGETPRGFDEGRNKENMRYSMDFYMGCGCLVLGILGCITGITMTEMPQELIRKVMLIGGGCAAIGFGATYFYRRVWLRRNREE